MLEDATMEVWAPDYLIGPLTAAPDVLPPRSIAGRAMLMTHTAIPLLKMVRFFSTLILNVDEADP
jgi:hypothetical protein